MAYEIKPLALGPGVEFTYPRGSSEGTAELIERLIVNVLKARDNRRRLLASVALPEDVCERVMALTAANAELYEVCDEKAMALVRDESGNGGVERLREILRRDLALCKSRAAIRADLNARLGGEASGESIKSYGTG